MADVWIVDDSPLDLERARRALASQRVETFTDGSSALERLSSGARPEVVLLDWMMPGVSGIEVCRYLRANDPGRCGILLLTAHNSVEQIVEGLASGADDFLPKPWEDAELRARVDALVRTRALMDRTRRAEAALRMLLEDVPEALFVCDDEGCVTFANATAAAVVGNPDEVDLHAMLPGLENVFTSGAKGAVPLPDVTISDRIFSPTANRSRDAIVVSLRDVTQRRRMEERRLDLYSIVAHDLRSPLNAILMRTELMRSGKRGILSADMHNDLSRIEMGIRSLSTMVNDFLDLARLETFDYSMKRERIDLGPVVRTALEDLKPLVDTSQLRLDWAVDDVLPVNADPRRMTQVMNNLVGNAIKFTPAGGEIRVAAHRTDGDVEVRITDTGSGIREDALPHIFRRYTRAVDTEQKVVGSGLGLMIVREIVEAHGGRVGVESRAGEGSTFWFRVPRAAG